MDNIDEMGNMKNKQNDNIEDNMPPIETKMTENLKVTKEAKKLLMELKEIGETYSDVIIRLGKKEQKKGD